MIALAPPLRPARPEDARALADLVNFAGEGLPHYLWSGLAAPGEDPWEIGRQRQEAKIGTAEIVVVDEGAGVLAALTGYAIPAEPEPVPEDMPALFRPLQELENLAPATWYVHVLAADPEARGRGHGTRLLAVAEALARAAGLAGMSIVVADDNAGARRLYARHGYHETARRPCVRDGWETASREWVLMTKSLPA